MNRIRYAWQDLWHRVGRTSREPGAALFQGLRLRLTLWYCAVLAAALILFSVALYFGAQYFLLGPIEADAVEHAHGHINQWLSGDPHACPSYGPFGQFGPPSGQGLFMSELVVCFNQNGSFLPYEDTTYLPRAFLSNTLVKTALQQGHASDVVDTGGTLGHVYRYAQAVPSPTGSGYIGVVVIGETIQAQQDAISLLLILLLAVGGVSLLGAGVGGLFLANRAMAPARLAWTNQQRFIADAAHELRTPLTLLRADAEVLLRSHEHMGAEDAALLEDIVAEANHMGNLASNLLTLARLDNNGYMHREHEVVNLAKLAQEGARRVEAFAEQSHISVEVENTGAPYVIGDPMLLEQAMLVLLDNAIKYNRPGGRVTVHTAVQDEQALLEVQDTGMGIAAEHLPHLGERFYRVDKARSREAGGTGLGLSIARSIAAVHGGTLTLHSIPEQGTTVSILLPLAHLTASDQLRDADGRVSSLPERTL